MPLVNLTDQYINDTYQNIAQYSDNKLGDGLGNEVSYLNLTASYALTASYVSGSTQNATSSYALTASYVQNAISASYITTAQTASYFNGSVSTSSYALTASYVSNIPTSSYVGTIGFKISSEGLNIQEGSKGYRHIAYDCNIFKYRIISNNEGNINVNIKRNNSLLGNISLNNQSSSLDSTLSGWIKELNENDLIEFYISGSSLYINDVTLFLDVINR